MGRAVLGDARSEELARGQRENITFFSLPSRELLAPPIARSPTTRAPQYSSACYAGYNKLKPQLMPCSGFKFEIQWCKVSTAPHLSHLFPKTKDRNSFTLKTFSFMHLRFPIGIRTDHDVNQHWLFDLPCLFKCTCQCCS